MTFIYEGSDVPALEHVSFRASILENVRAAKPSASEKEVLLALKAAPIVVLDEATAFADPENEVLIWLFE